jgi:hypothetical protein
MIDMPPGSWDCFRDGIGAGRRAGWSTRWRGPAISCTLPRCEVADYLRIWAAPRKLSANGSTLFANEGSQPVMLILNPTKSQVTGKV